jgi:hypothetical protein
MVFDAENALGLDVSELLSDIVVEAQIAVVQTDRSRGISRRVLVTHPTHGAQIAANRQ